MQLSKQQTVEVLRRNYGDNPSVVDLDEMISILYDDNDFTAEEIAALLGGEYRRKVGNTSVERGIYSILQRQYDYRQLSVETPY